MKQKKLLLSSFRSMEAKETKQVPETKGQTLRAALDKLLSVVSNWLPSYVTGSEYLVANENVDVFRRCLKVATDGQLFDVFRTLFGRIDEFPEDGEIQKGRPEKAFLQFLGSQDVEELLNHLTEDELWKYSPYLAYKKMTAAFGLVGSTVFPQPDSLEQFVEHLKKSKPGIIETWDRLTKDDKKRLIGFVKFFLDITA